MASTILSNESCRIDARIVEGVAEEVVINRFQGIEDRPKKFHAVVGATAALIAPALEDLAQAYRQACRTPCGRDAARVFLSNLLDAEA